MNNKAIALGAFVLVAGVVCVLSVGGLASAGEPDELVRTYVTGDVETLINISGNDVLVTIIGGENADKISSIYVYYNNKKLDRTSSNTYNDVKVDETIVFKDMAKGLSGKDLITVEAVFDDLTTAIIGTTYCDFS